MSISLGRHSYMGNIVERFDPIVEVGNFTSIGSDVTFYGTCQHPQLVSTFPFHGWSDEYPSAFSRGKITIGSDVWIGEQVLIMDGVTIHDGAVVGLGSVVTKDIPAFEVWGGNPAQYIKDRFGMWEVVHEPGTLPDFKPDGQVLVSNVGAVRQVNMGERINSIAWWNWDDEKIKEVLPYMTDINEFIRRYG